MVATLRARPVSRPHGRIRVWSAAAVARGIPPELEVAAVRADPISRLLLERRAFLRHDSLHGCLWVRIGRSAFSALRILGKDQVAALGAVPITRLRRWLVRRRLWRWCWVRIWRLTASARLISGELEIAALRAIPISRLLHEAALGLRVRIGDPALPAIPVPRELHVVAAWADPVPRLHHRRLRNPLLHWGWVLRAALPARDVLRELEIAARRADPITRFPPSTASPAAAT